LQLKKISIITPCLNAERHIAETIESVVGQSAILSGRAELEFIICDGNSKDATVAIVSSYCMGNNSIQLFSDPDAGMYAALAKGMQHVSGDIVAYINAGDFYNRCAFDIVLDLFEQKQVRWLTGYNVHYNDRSYFLNVKLPFRYRRDLFASGFYGTKLIFVQQESTFWDSALNQFIDLDRLAAFRYAGDYYLWSRFAQECDLQIVEAYLGGFRIEKGQLSENREAYLQEMMSLTSKPPLFQHILAAFDRVMWYAPVEFKKWFNKDGLFRYDHERQKWV
jgi:glycosyltransferase involved in cell wall biosynthesis